MSDPSSTMTENSIVAQFLGFSRQLIPNREAFKFEVKLSSEFSFNFNNPDQETTKSRKEDGKKKSPSTLKRIVARKCKFLEQKKKKLPLKLLLIVTNVIMMQSVKLA